MNFDKKRIVLLLFLLSYPSEYYLGIFHDENKIISNSLNLLVNLTKELTYLGKNFETKEFNSAVNKINLVCNETLADTVHRDIDEIIKLTEDTYKLDNLFPALTIQLKEYFPEIIVNEFRFRTIVAIQHQMNILYRKLSELDKLTSAAEFATFNGELSFIKTKLINRQIQILSLDANKNEKLRCWLAIDRMLNEIDISQSETGDQIIQRSPYGLIIKPGILLNGLTELNEAESNPEVKEYSDRILTKIKNAPPKYKEVNDTIIYEYNLQNKSWEKEPSMKALEIFNKAFLSENNDERILLYGEAIKDDSGFTAAYYNRGITFYITGDYQNAIRDFKRIIQLDSTYSTAYTNLGLSYFKLDDYNKAIDQLSAALKKGEKNLVIFTTRGLCYQKLNNYDDAVKDYSRAIEIDSNSFMSYSNRAECYKHLKKQNEVINDYKKLIELKPDNSTLYYNIGCIYFNNRDWEQAVKYWEEGLKINPEDPNIAANLPRAKKNLESKR